MDAGRAPLLGSFSVAPFRRPRLSSSVRDGTRISTAGSSDERASVALVQDTVREHTFRLQSMVKLMLDSHQCAVDTRLDELKERIDHMEAAHGSARAEVRTLRKDFDELKDSRMQSPQRVPSFNVDAVTLAVEQRIAAAQEELRQEISTLHVLVERSSINSGVIAVYLTECSREDKHALYSKLKARETALTQASADRRLSESRQNVEVLCGHLDESPRGGEFVIEVDGSIGVELATTSGPGARSLMVDSVDSGPFKHWNERNPASVVCLGDEIVEVNGQRGDAATLAREAARYRAGGSPEPLRLCLRHGNGR